MSTDSSDTRSARRPVGLVLCGGGSTRMGRPKEWLTFGDETLLQRVVRIASETVSPVIVCAAAGQSLPRLPPDVIRVDDPVPGRGPLQGLLTGLETAERLHGDPVFVTAADMPFLHAGLIRLLLGAIENRDDAVVLDTDDGPRPIPAIYRTRIRPTVVGMLAEGEYRFRSLLDRIEARRLPREGWSSLDPDGTLLANVNTPEEYLALLERDLHKYH